MSHHENWQRVSKQNPCPVCGKPDWCLVANDGSSAICPRTESGAQKYIDRAGWLHKLQDTAAGDPNHSGSIKAVDFKALADKCCRSLNQGKLMEMSSHLGVSCQSLKRLGVGWDGQCYTIPMHDAAGSIIGIQRRSNNHKTSVKGSKLGLFIPSGLNSENTLLICEGPSDTAAAIDLGFEAIGRPNCSGGTELLKQFCANSSQIIIVADNDNKGKEGAKRLCQELAEDCSDVRIICPPENIKDLRQWYKAGLRADKIKQLIEQSQPVSSWQVPAPLGHFELPEFPVEAFPENLSILRQFSQAVAQSFQVPADLPAMLALSVGASALAKKVVVHVRADHWEPVNLFTAVAMLPASRKSAVFRAMTRPIVAFEKQLLEKLAPEIEKQKQQILMIQDSRKVARKKAVSSKSCADREFYKDQVQELTDELNGLKLLNYPQLLADDATPESIALLLADNGGKLAVLSPEGDVFDFMAGRYSKTPNLGVYLKGHAGDEIRINRANTEFVPRFINKPALTIGVAVQPDVLRGLTENKGFRGRGLLGRFLYSMPKSILGQRKINTEPIPADIEAKYSDLITKALELEPRVDENQEPHPHIIGICPEALKECDRFAEEIETRLGTSGDLEAIGDWAGKLVGAACRIAGILHGLMYAGAGELTDNTISQDTMLGAISIAEHLIPHAKAAFFEMGANPVMDLARKMLKWLKNKHIPEFTKRDAFNALRGSVQTVSEIEEPLEILISHGYIRQIPIYRSGPGRDPSPKFKTNRLWLAQITHNAQNYCTDTQLKEAI